MEKGKIAVPWWHNIWVFHYYFAACWHDDGRVDVKGRGPHPVIVQRPLIHCCICGCELFDDIAGNLTI